MLPNRQFLTHHMYGEIRLPQIQKLENGAVEIKLVDQSKIPLPDVETTRLSACLAAGVDLKQVPSKVLPSTDTLEVIVGEPLTNEESSGESNDA